MDDRNIASGDRESFCFLAGLEVEESAVADKPAVLTVEEGNKNLLELADYLDGVAERQEFFGMAAYVRKAWPPGMCRSPSCAAGHWLFHKYGEDRLMGVCAGSDFHAITRIDFSLNVDDDDFNKKVWTHLFGGNHTDRTARDEAQVIREFVATRSVMA
jgi:hypothetical protein